MRHNQNRRSRGRPNNNRKGPNPLTRSYESNGPDVKVRGTAMHVAEKYMSLARDALSSGDNVAAENYLQHAEHYNRIVAAAQAQQQLTQPAQPFREGEEGDDDGMTGRTRDRFGYYNEPELDENGEERLDATGLGDDDGDRQIQQRPQPQQQRPEFRGQDGRDGQNRPDRGYNADRPRRDGEYRDYRPENRDRPENRNGYRADNRNDAPRGDGRGEYRNDNRGDGRNDNRRDRYNGDRPRQDYREGRGDEPVRMNGDYGRSEQRPERGETAPEPYTADAARADDRDFRDAGGPNRDDRDDRAMPVDLTATQDRAEPDFAPAAEEVAPRPRRRRAPRAAARVEEGDAGTEPEGTPDGAAALAAFPD